MEINVSQFLAQKMRTSWLFAFGEDFGLNRGKCIEVLRNKCVGILKIEAENDFDASMEFRKPTFDENSAFQTPITYMFKKKKSFN